ncbi:MAG TPA: type II toxin-antitoxin system HicA family toxin [Candidatus Nanoarchaeia archaeon]|nr:hypothetical protein [uncultured archaeon]
MSKLPTNIRPLELIKALERLGFVEKMARGSHRRLVHADGRMTQVAVHPKPIPTGTLGKILKQTQISVEDLEKNL